MKKVFEVTDKKMIEDILDKVEYGTLAVSAEDKPYAVPVNFVRIKEDIYFHGALSNRKMKMLKQNPNVSFSVVENYALIPSFFSSQEGLACPATQFFKSVSIEGKVEVEESRQIKAAVFEKMMAKLQPEGGYKPFSDAAYDMALKKTALVKIVPTSRRAKFKFGQHLSEERFDMVCKHLEKRATELDKETLIMMHLQRV